MSTRSCIARQTGETDFRGVYHHWDGYPTGLGHTLFHLYREQFDRDLPRMLATLIDEHPAGWSTINNADWSLPIGFVNDHDSNAPCAQCAAPLWQHYHQYYTAEHGFPVPPKMPADGSYAMLDHTHQHVDQPKGPQCYCHGDRHETGSGCTSADAAGSGCEYAYVFTDAAHMLVLSSYDRDGDKMIGMFGSGDPDSTWRVIGDVDLNGAEPNWDAIG